MSEWRDSRGARMVQPREDRAKVAMRDEVRRWLSEDYVARATDGCEVALDGECEHGNLSWLVVMGVLPLGR
jgi:hypothetical protein